MAHQLQAGYLQDSNKLGSDCAVVLVCACLVCFSLEKDGMSADLSSSFSFLVCRSLFYPNYREKPHHCRKTSHDLVSCVPVTIPILTPRGSLYVYIDRQTHGQTSFTSPVADSSWLTLLSGALWSCISKHLWK